MKKRKVYLQVLERQVQEALDTFPEAKDLVYIGSQPNAKGGIVWNRKTLSKCAGFPSYLEDNHEWLEFLTSKERNGTISNYLDPELMNREPVPGLLPILISKEEMERNEFYNGLLRVEKLRQEFERMGNLLDRMTGINPINVKALEKINARMLHRQTELKEQRQKQRRGE